MPLRWRRSRCRSTLRRADNRPFVRLRTVDRRNHSFASSIAGGRAGSQRSLERVAFESPSPATSRDLLRTGGRVDPGSSGTEHVGRRRAARRSPPRAQHGAARAPVRSTRRCHQPTAADPCIADQPDPRDRRCGLRALRECRRACCVGRRRRVVDRHHHLLPRRVDLDPGARRPPRHAPGTGPSGSALSFGQLVGGAVADRPRTRHQQRMALGRRAGPDRPGCRRHIYARHEAPAECSRRRRRSGPRMKGNGR